MTALLERRNRLINEVAEQESTHKQTEPRWSGNVRAAEDTGNSPMRSKRGFFGARNQPGPPNSYRKR
jgi:hypothetical protein